MLRARLVLGVLTVCLMLPGTTAAAPFVVNFDAFSDGQVLTNQIPGLTVTGGVVLSAGLSLNEFDLPPHSGANVLGDNGGPLSIAFASPLSSVGAYFTYLEAVTLSAFDSGNNPLGSISSAFDTNLVSFPDPGSAPNEFLQISVAGITRLVVTGNVLGGSFVLDDLTLSDPPTAAPAAVPEPGTISLVVLGSLGLAKALRAASRPSNGRA